MEKKNFMNILLIVLLVVASISAIYFYSKSLPNQAKEEVVASVNGVNITKTELYEVLVKQDGQQALEGLISDKIVELELQKQNITVTEEEIQTEIQKTIEHFGGQEAFDQALKSYGYSLADIKKDVELNLKVIKMFEPQIKITEDEMKAYFEENKDAFQAEGQEKPATYEESKDAVKEALFNEKMQTVYGNWFDTKYNEYKVENFLVK